MIFAHSTNDSDRNHWEPLEAHSRRVAERTEAFGSVFGIGELARLAGLLHDLGKVKPAFQAKLTGKDNGEPHSGEGAVAAGRREYGNLGKIMAFCIAGHHGHLSNGLGASYLETRLKQTREVPLPDWLQMPGKLALPDPLGMAGNGDVSAFYAAQFLTRMLYSCLTDADSLETSVWEAEAAGERIDRSPKVITPDHRDAFNEYMTRLDGKTGAVNVKRSEILSHVRAGAALDPGVFTLTVPTGGGKTLASLGFSLDHALKHGLSRVIYVIPYMSIVEQTADVFGAVLGRDPETVVEHHSSFDWDGLDDPAEGERLRQAVQTWDAPVIVTTAVQFFESLYAARKARCRKLHNIARSVIVVDEAQTMPLRLLRPCLAALNELMRAYGCSVVLSTATQPALTRASGFPHREAFEGVRELAPEPARLYRALSRVTVRNAGQMNDADVVGQMSASYQGLVIVDSRAHARALFEQLRIGDGAAHLSTSMTAAHRRSVLADVRSRLEAKQRVRLVATSLIEAGVDVDFPLVLRAAAGIDSVAQAAGRCNREGRLDGPGEVIVFRPEAKWKVPPDIEQFARIGAEVLAAYGDPLSLDAVATYFDRLFRERHDFMDTESVGNITGILAAIDKTGNRFDFAFEDIARAFRFITDEPLPVIVRGAPWGVPADLLKNLEWREGAGGIARALQPYVVNLPRWRREALVASGAASWWRRDIFDRQFAVLNDEGLGESGLYDPCAGLSMDTPLELGLMNI